MTNTDTPSATPSTRTRRGDALGKATKSHSIFTLTGKQVVIIGHTPGSDEQTHAAELMELAANHSKFLGSMASTGVWCLASPESNDSPVSDQLVASISSRQEVEIPGKVIRVPLTEATKHLAYVDDAGQVHDFYLAVCYGRKRTRAIRDLGLSMLYKVAPKSATLDDASMDMLIENLVRRQLSPTAEAQELAKLAAGGMSLLEIAAKLGEHSDTPSDRTIANKLKLNSLTAAVAKLVDSGELKLTNAYSIADLPKGKQSEIAAQVIDGKLTTTQTKALVKELIGAKPSDGKPIDTGTLPSHDVQDKPVDDQQSDERPAKYDALPTFDSIATTPAKRPKADEIDEMIHYLGGEHSPLAKRPAIKLAVAMLHWVRGSMTEDQLLLKVAALHKVDVDALVPSEPEPEPKGE